MSLTTKLTLKCLGRYTSALDLAANLNELDYTKTIELADGTTAGKADKIFHDQRTLAASASEDLDLAGSLLDAFGAAITFARIKALIIAAAAANTNNVVVGAAAANAWAALLGATGTLTVRPGTAVAVFAGKDDATAYVVTAGTGDLLKIANSAGGTPITYDIILVGSSA